MIFVLGIDGAAWTVIKSNLDSLTSFRKLCDVGKSKTLVLNDSPMSASVWCSMFSGKTPAEHGHNSYVVNDKIVRRQDIDVDFIWDILQKRGGTAKALNVPFVVPPFSFGVAFRPIGFGLPTNEREWDEELKRVTDQTRELLLQEPDLLITVYTLLDRVQHFHWGEECVAQWYRKLDARIGELIFDTGFLDKGGNKLIVISDHGFCSFGEAKTQTLPMKTEYGEVKGDHHEEALLITVNIACEIGRVEEVFHCLKTELGVQ